MNIGFEKNAKNQTVDCYS